MRIFFAIAAVFFLAACVSQKLKQMETIPANKQMESENKEEKKEIQKEKRKKEETPQKFLYASFDTFDPAPYIGPLTPI